MSPWTDLSHLPTDNRNGREGLLPDEEPRFVDVLVNRWATENDDDKPTAMGTPFRHSDAGKCARAISYTAAGVPKSDPMDLSGVFNVTLGSMLHDLWQEALVEQYPDAEIELKVRTVGADGSGHIDAVVRTEVEVDDIDIGGADEGDIPIVPEMRPYVIAIELKTAGGFAFKSATGTNRKGTPAEGPKSGHLLQAAINGLAVDADEIVVAYLGKESLSVNVAARFGATELERFCCEWTFTRDQYQPLAEREAERVSKILALVDEGQLAPRAIPDLPTGAEIIDPSTGAYEVTVDGEVDDTGSWWECGYCSYQTLCSTTERGRIPIESVVAVEVAS